MREEFEREKRMYSYEDHNERGPASYDKSADQLEDSGNGFPVPNAVHSIAMSLGIDVETSAPTETSSYLPSIKSAKQKEVSVDQPTEVQVRSVVSARIGEIARDDEGDYDHDDYYEDFEDGHTADNQQPTCGGDDKEEKYSSSSSSKISASNTIDYNAAPPIPDVDLIWEESVLIAGRSQYVDQGKDAKDLVQQAKEMDDEDEYDNDFHEDTEHQIAADKDSESNIGATGEGIGQIDSTNSYHVSPNSVTNSSTVQKNSNQEEEEHYDTSHRKTGLTGSKNNHPRVSTAQSESDAYGDDFDDYDQDDDFKD